MKRPPRLMAPALVLLALTAPALTLHALIRHMIWMGGASDVPREFGLSVVAILAFAAIAPFAGLIVVALDTARSVRHVGQLHRLSEPREAFGIPYRMIEGAEVAMFAGGLTRPAIFATRGAERLLTPEQFRAGLMHEQAHLQRGDVLDRMLIRATARVFGWLPGVHSLADALVLRSEFAADRQALSGGAGPLALVEAIISATGVRGPEPALGTSASAARLQAIVEPVTAPAPVPLRGPVSLLGWHLGLPLAAHGATLFGLACATHF